MTAPRYIGLISGTSRDGVDAALVTMDQGLPRLLGATCTPYPAALRERLDTVIAERRRPAAGEHHALDRDIGQFFAEACLGLLEETGHESGDVQAIGSHGQTIWHEPAGTPPVSIQLGDARTLTRATGIPVVSDFRSPDLDAGGQGAPLAPLLHRALFGDQAPCAVLNLGGIANLTLLGADGSVAGFDTGPANCLMDGWCRRHRGEHFDRDGAWAASGQMLPSQLERWLTDPFFSDPPPKSTGLEVYNAEWLTDRLAGDEAPADVQRTLLQLTVESVADALEAHPLDRPESPLLLCGGGTHNGFLVSMLERRLPDRSISSTERYGVHPDWVEAILFAWLAHERLEGHPQDTPPITGATHPVLLGKIDREPALGATA